MRMTRDEARAGGWWSGSTMFIKACHVMGVVYLTLVYALGSVALGTQFYAREVPWVLALYAGYWCLVIAAWGNLRNVFGTIVSISALVLVWWVVNETLVRPDAITAFPRLGALGWVMISLVTLSALPHLVNLGLITARAVARRGTVNWGATLKRQFRHRRTVHVALLVAGATVGTTMIACTWLVPKDVVTITPQEYTMNFAFWGSHYHARYTPAQLDAMNRHAITIAPYTVPPLTASEAVRAAFKTEMEWWMENCSAVSFLVSIPGIPGGFVWDGGTAGTIAAAKETVQFVQREGLTNVRGLAFDWENPIEETLADHPYLVDVPNRTRHETSRQLWAEFFDWMDLNAPEMFLSNINYVEMSQDAYDGDFDLHLAESFNTFEEPRYDEYAPMIYRCPCRGTPPFGDVPRWDAGTNIDTTYDFYQRLRTHVEGVEYIHGSRARASVYVGITNCTCYGRDVEVYEEGEYLGHGFDVLVRDLLVCKHFGMETVTIFILDTVVENDHSMGGVFESYGDDFLDRLNASVNGPGATTPFVLRGDPFPVDDSLFVTGSTETLLWDFVLNFDAPPLFAVLVGALFAALVPVLLYERALTREKTREAPL